MESEEKPEKSPNHPHDAASSSYVPPPLKSAAQRQSPAAYTPGPVSYTGQYTPPPYAPSQYIPPTITSPQISQIDPMAPVVSAVPPSMNRPIAFTNPPPYSENYLPTEPAGTPFLDSPTRTVFLPRKSNPILGFIVVGVIGMMGIVIVGLVVALSKKDDARESSIALISPRKQSAESKNSTSAQTPTNTDANIESRTNYAPDNQDKSPSKQVDPPELKQETQLPRIARDKFRNDRPNRPMGMANKNRPRPPQDALPKTEPKNETAKMPVPTPSTNSASAPPDTSKMPPNAPEIKPPTQPIPATVEPVKSPVVVNQENQKATPEQEKEFFNALKNIRTALENRDFDTAKKEQAKADKLAISEDMKTMAEGMDMISQYNEIFWKSVQNGMRNLNGEVEIGSQVAFVITSNSESMTLRMQGKNREFIFNTLPVGLAVAIAKRVMADDPANKATLGSFYFTHPKMQKLTEAKEFLSAAKKGGVKTEPALFLIEKEHLITTK